MNFKGKIEVMKQIVIDNSIPYASLHQHSYYSLLDGLASPAHIVEKANSLGHGAVAITDHGSVSCLSDLVKACREYQIKPLVGVEFYVVDSLEKAKQKRYHLTVLAKTWRGVESIFRQLTLANKQFYYRTRISFEQALDFEDCIIMSACSSGPLSHPEYEMIHEKLHSRYKDDYYLEVMPHNYEEQRMVNERAQYLSQKTGACIVATTDAHYVNKEDHETHEVLLAIQTRAKWDKADRFGKNWPDVEFKDRHTLIRAFESLGYERDDIERWIQATNEVAGKINIIVPSFTMHLPSPLDYEEECCG